MSDSTDSDGSVIFVAEQHTVRVQVHQPGDPTVIPEHSTINNTRNTG